MNAIKENNSLLDGPSASRVLRHNTAALQEELYLCMGKMIALSIVHGGPGKFILLAHTKLHPFFEHYIGTSIISKLSWGKRGNIFGLKQFTLSSCRANMKQAAQFPKCRERAPMGGAPYKSAKEGAGHSFECFRIKFHERALLVTQSSLHGGCSFEYTLTLYRKLGQK